MTLLDWMKLHKTCPRGAAYVEGLAKQALETKQSFYAEVWAQTYRGDWLCWLLDSALCTMREKPHDHCILLYDRGCTGWWTVFEKLRKKHKVESSLARYLARDNKELWTRETLLMPMKDSTSKTTGAQGLLDQRKAALWEESAAAIRKYYAPLWEAVSKVLAGYASPFS